MQINGLGDYSLHRIEKRIEYLKEKQQAYKRSKLPVPKDLLHEYKRFQNYQRRFSLTHYFKPPDLYSVIWWLHLKGQRIANGFSVGEIDHNTVIRELEFYNISGLMAVEIFERVVEIDRIYIELITAKETPWDNSVSHGGKLSHGEKREKETSSRQGENRIQ